MGEWEEFERGAKWSYHPGVDSHGHLRINAQLAALDSGFRSVKRNDFPAFVRFDDYDRPVWATKREEFIEMSGQTLEIVEAWVAEQEIAIENACQGRNE